MRNDIHKCAMQRKLPDATKGKAENNSKMEIKENSANNKFLKIKVIKSDQQTLGLSTK